MCRFQIHARHPFRSTLIRRPDFWNSSQMILNYSLVWIQCLQHGKAILHRTRRSNRDYSARTRSQFLRTDKLGIPSGRCRHRIRERRRDSRFHSHVFRVSSTMTSASSSTARTSARRRRTKITNTADRYGWTRRRTRSLRGRGRRRRRRRGRRSRRCLIAVSSATESMC